MHWRALATMTVSPRALKMSSVSDAHVASGGGGAGAGVRGSHVCDGRLDSPAGGSLRPLECVTDSVLMCADLRGGRLWHLRVER